MTQRIDLKVPTVVAYQFDGKITKDDVKSIHDDLRTAMGQSDKVRFFADVRHMDSVEPGALMDNLKLTPEYTSEIDRFAVVGNKDWQSWLTKTSDILTQGEARFFASEDVDKARSWISS